MNKFSAYPDGFSFLNELELSDDARSKVTRNLIRIVEGSKTIIAHPYLKNNSVEHVVKSWDDIYNRKIKIVSLPDTLVKMEAKNRSSISPRSIAVPWDERRNVLNNSYDNVSMNNFVLPNISQLKYPNTHRLRPKSYKEATDDLKSNTSSGLPYLMKKGLVKDVMLANFKTDLDSEYPCCLFTRTQENMKTRNVWGYPSADTIHESSYFQVFSEYFEKHLPFRKAIVSPIDVDTAVTSLINKAVPSGKQLLSIDFSNFDDSAKPPLVRLAFDYIKSVFQHQYSSIIDDIFIRFTTIGIITPDGIKSGEHGISSGSPGTNTIGSLVQYLIAQSYGIEDHEMQVQGDDGVYLVESPEQLETYFESVGLTVNRLKGHISPNEVIYLQNLHTSEIRDSSNICRGIYPTYRALGRIIYPERFTDYEKYGISGSDFNSIRAISILENCKWHPFFYEFVEFIAKVVDNTLLDYSQKGLSLYSSLISNRSGSGRLFNYRIGSDLRGLNSFETVKIIAKLKPS